MRARRKLQVAAAARLGANTRFWQVRSVTGEARPVLFDGMQSRERSIRSGMAVCA